MRFLLIILIAFTLHARLAQAAELERIIVNLSYLHCQKCGETLTKAFEQKSSVKRVQVNVTEKSLFLIYQKGSTPSDTTIRDIVRSAGYTVTDLQHL